MKTEIHTQKVYPSWWGFVAFAVFFLGFGLFFLFLFVQRGVVFGSGSLVYSFSSFFDLKTSFWAYVFVIFLFFIAACISYIAFYQFQKNTFYAWVLAFVYALSPYFFKYFIDTPILLFFLIGFPTWLFLYSATQHTLWGFILTLVWSIIWTFFVPFSALVMLVFVIASRQWLSSHFHSQEKTLFRGTHSSSNIMAVYVIFLILGLLFTAKLVPYFSPDNSVVSDTTQVASVKRAAVTQAQRNSVDAIWLLDFPVNLFFPFYFPNNITEASENSVPSLVLFIFLGVILYFIHEKKVGDMKAQVQWMFSAAVVFLILSLGPFLKIFSNVKAPLIPLPGSLLLYANNIDYVPHYFLAPAMLAVLLIFSSVTVLIRPPKRNIHTFKVAGAFLLFFLMQYVVSSFPVTAGYHPTGYDKILDHEVDAIVLENTSPQRYQQSIQNWRYNRHGLTILDQVDVEGRRLFNIMQVAASPFIPQNAPEDIAYFLSTRHVSYFDYFRRTISMFDPGRVSVDTYLPILGDTSEQDILMNVSGMDKVYEDDDHALYKVLGTEPKESFLTFISLDSSNERVVLDKKKKSYEAMSMIDGAVMNYYNYTDDLQTTYVRMKYDSFESVKLTIFLDHRKPSEREIYSAEISSGVTDGALLFTLPDVGPGDHTLTFFMRDDNGRSYDDFGFVKGLRIKQVTYTLSERVLNNNETP